MKRMSVLCCAIVFLCAWSSVAFGETVLTYLVYSSSGQASLDWTMRQVEEFNKTNGKGIRVDVIVGNQEKMRTMMAAGVPPDMLSMSDFGYLARQGWFVDIKPFLLRDNLMKLFNHALLAQLEKDGGIYTVPWFINAGASYFNRDLFDNAGVATPIQMGANWTWEAMLTASKKLTIDADGNGLPESFGIDRVYAYFPTAVAQAGGAFYEFDEKEQPIRSLWNTPEVRMAAEYVLNFYTSGTVPHKYHLEGRLNQAAYYFWEGKTAINVTDHLGILDSYLRNAAFEWDFALQPIGPAGPINHMDNSIGGPNILTTCKDVEAAWEFMKFYLMDRDRMIGFVRDVGVLPALLSAQPSYPVLKNLGNKNFAAVFEQSSFPSKRPLYTVERFLIPRFVSLDQVWSGRKPVETMLLEIHEQMSAFIKEQLDK